MLSPAKPLRSASFNKSDRQLSAALIEIHELVDEAQALGGGLTFVQSGDFDAWIPLPMSPTRQGACGSAPRWRLPGSDSGRSAAHAVASTTTN